MSTVSIINAIFDHTKKQNIPRAYKTTHRIFNCFMGINEFELTPTLIASLFPDSLVVPGSPTRQVIAGKGGNRQNISFLVHEPAQQFLTEKNLTFLLRILTPCKLSIEDIYIVNTAITPVKFTEYSKEMGPRIIFCWGILPSSVGLDKGLPELSTTMVNGISVIPVHSIETMQSESPESTELKKRLWTCLKKLFAL
jgi:hypothetical protein